MECQQGRSLPHRAIRGWGIGPFGGQSDPGVSGQILWRGGQRVETVQGPAPGAYGVDEQVDGCGGVGQRQRCAEEKRTGYDDAQRPSPGGGVPGKRAQCPKRDDIGDEEGDDGQRVTDCPVDRVPGQFGVIYRGNGVVESSQREGPHKNQPVDEQADQACADQREQGVIRPGAAQSRAPPRIVGCGRRTVQPRPGIGEAVPW